LDLKCANDVCVSDEFHADAMARICWHFCSLPKVFTLVTWSITSFVLCFIMSDCKQASSHFGHGYLFVIMDSFVNPVESNCWNWSHLKFGESYL
jgi:hypothetical protein